MLLFYTPLPLLSRAGIMWVKSDLLPRDWYPSRDCVNSPCAWVRPSMECSVVWLRAHAHLDLTKHGNVMQWANQQNGTSGDVVVGHTPPLPLLSRTGIMWVKKDATTFFPGQWGDSRAPVKTFKVRAMLCSTPQPTRQVMCRSDVWSWKGTLPPEVLKRGTKPYKRDPCQPLRDEIIDSFMHMITSFPF